MLDQWPHSFFYILRNPGLGLTVLCPLVCSNHKLSNITMLSIVLSLNVACTYVTTEHVTDCSETYYSKSICDIQITALIEDKLIVELPVNITKPLYDEILVC